VPDTMRVSSVPDGNVSYSPRFPFPWRALYGGRCALRPPELRHRAIVELAVMSVSLKGLGGAPQRR
jgi:hypothetical protein